MLNFSEVIHLIINGRCCLNTACRNQISSCGLGSFGRHVASARTGTARHCAGSALARGGRMALGAPQCDIAELRTIYTTMS